MRIQKAEVQDLPVLADMARRLWPDHTVAEMAEELAEMLEQADAAFFLAFQDETAAGFAQCQLRYDYVEGTESSPVGYLEGVYVMEPFRKQGVARALLKACEAWAMHQGCREFASDCELDNRESMEFHRKAGFAEANRIICFTKKLAE